MHRYLISSLITLILLTGCGNQQTQAPPPEFADFPLYPNAQDIDYSTPFGKGTLTFTITGSMADLKGWYMETLGQRGWKINSLSSGDRFRDQYQEVLSLELNEPTETQSGRIFNIYMTPQGATVDGLVDALTYDRSASHPGP